MLLFLNFVFSYIKIRFFSLSSMAFSLHQMYQISFLAVLNLNNLKRSENNGLPITHNIAISPPPSLTKLS